jgi:hypothetical protein
MTDIDIKRLKYPEQTEVMLHSADPKLTLSHVEYWLNPLINSGIKFSVLVRDTENFKKLKSKYPYLQILYAKKPVDVETVVTRQPSLKAVLYPANRAKNIHLLRFIELKHIFLGTKNSDKQNKINKSYRAYDEIWVSGQAMVEKFNEEIDELGGLKFRIIGRPQYMNFFMNEEMSGKDEILFLPSAGKDIFSFGTFIELLLSSENERYIIESKDKKFLDDAVKSKGERRQNVMIGEPGSHEFPMKLVVADIDKVNRFLLLYQAPILVFIPKNIDISSMDLDLPDECFYTFSNAKEYKKTVEEIKNDDFKKSIREYWLENYFSPDKTRIFAFKRSLGEVTEGTNP